MERPPQSTVLSQGEWLRESSSTHFKTNTSAYQIQITTLMWPSLLRLPIASGSLMSTQLRNALKLMRIASPARWDSWALRLSLSRATLIWPCLLRTPGEFSIKNTERLLMRNKLSISRVRRRQTFQLQKYKSISVEKLTCISTRTHLMISGSQGWHKKNSNLKWLVRHLSTPTKRQKMPRWSEFITS